MNAIAVNWIWVAAALAIGAFYLFGRRRDGHGYARHGHGDGQGTNNHPQAPDARGPEAGSAPSAGNPDGTGEQRPHRRHRRC
jgi:hypothetical protein